MGPSAGAPSGLRRPCRRRKPRVVVLSAAVSLLAAIACVHEPGLAAAEGSASHSQHWVASWAASPSDSLMPTDATGSPAPLVLINQTLRMIVTPHQAGEVARIHLSNRFGPAAATFGHVTAGIAGTDSVSELQPVTFGGKQQVTVPAGQDIVSDPVPLSVQAFTPLAVNMFMPGVQSLPTKHFCANATSFSSLPAAGDLATTSSNGSFPQRTRAWQYVNGIDVQAPPSTGAIVAFGESITDGYVAATALSVPATAAVADKNRRYPDDLQRRLAAAGIPLSVVNAGISSNRLITDGRPLMMGPSGLQRFKQDALDVPGVTGVLLLEGINDLGIPPATTTASQLIAGYKQVIDMAHARGVKIWMGTILPASNAFFDGRLLAPLSETYRQQANTWIRSQQLSDGIVDFDAALRDPANHKVLNPRYSGPDNLHPNLLGYQKMANTVNLPMLKTAQ